MKLFSRILVLLTAAGSFSGCLSHTKVDDSTGYIRLRPVIGCGTRSGEDYIAFPEDRTFSMYAISEDSGDKILDDVTVSSRGTRGWFPENTPLWPYGESLKFVGYWPSSLQMTCDREGTLKMSSYRVEGSGEDLLVTDPTRSYTKNDSIVGLPFYHALAKIDFRVMHGLGGNTRVRVEKIGINGIYTLGGFDSSSDLKWSTAGEPQNITVYEADGEGTEVFTLTPRILGDSMFVLPQGGGASIEVTYAFSTGGSGWLTGQKMSTPAMTGRWEADRHYTYTLKIQDDRLAYTTGISSWYEDLQN